MAARQMQVHIIYPVQTPLSFWRSNRLELLRLLFVWLGYLCALINFLTGGTLWSLAVIGGLVLLWVAVFYKPLVENTAIKKISDVGITVCLYLFLLEGVFGGNWSGFVVPIVLFSDLIVAGTYFLAFFKKEKRNFLPLFELTLGGLIAIFCGLVGWSRLDWPLIVVGGVSLALITLTVALHFQAIKLEFQKKIHR
ncbi:MAG: DUF6320 domain-containing protein [Eubacteriales bacterium]|nr:DUF6320 domain-containing protein [Eubacteriales bacterium]